MCFDIFIDLMTWSTSRKDVLEYFVKNEDMNVLEEFGKIHPRAACTKRENFSGLLRFVCEFETFSPRHSRCFVLLWVL